MVPRRRAISFGLVAREKKTHGVYAVCLAGSDILLLSSAGQTLTARGVSRSWSITDDGTKQLKSRKARSS